MNLLRFGLIVAGVIVFLDQLSKWLLLEKLFGLSYFNPVSGFPWADSVDVTSFFNLVTVWNRGVSFGMFSNDSQYGPWALSILALGISLGLVVWLRKIETKWMALALGLVIGGAVGNVADRIRFNAVFDYLDFHVMGYHWPAFNVADSAIFIGVGLILCDGLFARKNITT